MQAHKAIARQQTTTNRQCEIETTTSQRVQHDWPTPAREGNATKVSAKFHEHEEEACSKGVQQDARITRGGHAGSNVPASAGGYPLMVPRVDGVLPVESDEPCIVGGPVTSD